MSAASLDHLVGELLDVQWQIEVECFRGRQVHDQIKFGRLLDRDVARLRPAENLVDVVAGAPEQVSEAWSVGHQTSRFNVLPQKEDCRHSCSERQGVNLDPVGDYERIANNIECLRAALERLERGRDVSGPPYFTGGYIESALARTHLRLWR